MVLLQRFGMFQANNTTGRIYLSALKRERGESFRKTVQVKISYTKEEKEECTCNSGDFGYCYN
jgi:CTP synthase (UTP-ammonia lyase)